MNVNSSDNSYTSASYSNKGVSGLASGMDTEGLVQALLSDVQKKIDKQEQQQQVYEWKQEEYRDVIDKINEFKDKYLSVTGEKSIGLTSTFTSSVTESTSSAVKATATSDALEGSFTVEVEKLATAAKFTSDVSASAEMEVSIGSSAIKTNNKSYTTITTGEHSIEIDISGAISNDDLVDKINEGIQKYNKVNGTSVSISASLSDGKIVYSGTGENSVFEVDGNGTLEKTGTITTGTYNKDNTITLELDGKSLKIDLAGSTDIAQTINDAIKNGDFKDKIQASVTDGKLSLTATDDTASFKLSGTKVGLATIGLKESSVSSEDGKIELEGSIETEQNKITIGDTDITLEDDDTAETIAQKINDAGIADIKATVKDGKLTITGKNDASEVTVTGTAADLAKFGLDKENKATVSSKMETEPSEINSIGTLNIKFNGLSKGIKITDTDTMDSLREKLYDAFGSGIRIDDDGNFVTGTGKSIAVSGSKEVMEYLGMEEKGASNYIDTSKSISDLYGVAEDEEMSFTINGTDFTFKGTTSLADVMAEVNSSRAGVSITYNSLNDKFSIKSNETGSDAVINAQDKNESGGLIQRMFGTSEISKIGEDAKVYIDGEEVSYSGNDISYNGINLTLRGVTDGEVTIETSTDTEKALDSIVSFVEDYNALIEDLNKRIHTKAEYKQYAPLTDAQEDEMTEKEIEKWTEKSKTGLLSGDSEISKFLQEMRTVLYTKIEGVPLLSDIGIEASSDWNEYGKLTIDKDKLTDALENDMKSVSDIFTGRNGIANRLDSACKKAANTSSASPGTLVTLAGVKGKATEKNNTITDKIASIKEKIERLKEQYETRKERYWKQFNAMETALSSMNSTSTWLSSMLMGG